MNKVEGLSAKYYSHFILRTRKGATPDLPMLKSPLQVPVLFQIDFPPQINIYKNDYEGLQQFGFEDNKDQIKMDHSIAIVQD